MVQKFLSILHFSYQMDTSNQLCWPKSQHAQSQTHPHPQNKLAFCFPSSLNSKHQYSSVKHLLKTLEGRKETDLNRVPGTTLGIFTPCLI